MDHRLRTFFEVLIVVVLFLSFSYLIQSNLSFLEGIIGNNPLGVATYMLIEVSSIVIAPVTTFPLIILASNLFGWFNAGVYSLIAWVVGSYLAFIIARRYGLGIVKRFVSLDKIHKFEEEFSRENLFASMIFFRILFPTDILSYAAGIFSKISTRDFIFATIIGLAPFAFGLALFGKIDFIVQVIIVTLMGILVLMFWLIKIVYARYKFRLRMRSYR